MHSPVLKTYIVNCRSCGSRDAFGDPPGSPALIDNEAAWLVECPRCEQLHIYRKSEFAIWESFWSAA